MLLNPPWNLWFPTYLANFIMHFYTTGYKCVKIWLLQVFLNMLVRPTCSKFNLCKGNFFEQWYYAVLKIRILTDWRENADLRTSHLHIVKYVWTQGKSTKKGTRGLRNTLCIIVIILTPPTFLQSCAFVWLRCVFQLQACGTCSVQLSFCV